MRKGVSLHIGVDIVSPGPPATVPLLGCKNDAREMSRLAEARGFAERELLLDQDATHDRVVQKLQEIALRLKGLNDGGTFFFTFAGHGSFKGDEDSDELDSQDETLMLHDFALLDDELRLDVWPRFDANVRVVMIADSCHSGTVHTVPALSAAKTEYLSTARSEMKTDISEVATSQARVRSFSEAARIKHNRANKSFYDHILSRLPAEQPINASVLLLAACEDHKTTADGFPHGEFTQALLDDLASPKPAQNYNVLIRNIGARLAGRPQTPVLSTTGRVDPAFLAEVPFTV
jgi:outer membrane murein-binding lipoprotein Lpp